jgi:hypothetical protein
VKILPQLEAYRDRLAAKAEAWRDTPEAELRRDLDQSLQQASLLDRSVGDLRARATEARGEEAAAIETRLAVQEQMRDLTAAYAEALRMVLERERI